MFDLTPEGIEMVTLLALGIAALCLGLPGLFARQPADGSRASWRRALTLSLLLALVGLTTLVAGLASYVWVPPLALASVWLLFAVLRTDVPASMGRFLARLVAQPRVQAAAVVLAGGSLITWQAHWLTRNVENALSETDALLAVITAAPPLEEHPEVSILTDAGQRVPLWRAQIAYLHEDLSVEALYLHDRGYDDKLIRTAPPDITHNCHGWVFSGGKGWIRAVHVDQILRENRYVVASQPMPGDVAIYRDGMGIVSHTALVRAVSEDGSVLQESKWGKLGRFVHTASQHVYANASCTYYRSPRGSHLVRLSNEM